MNPEVQERKPRKQRTQRRAPSDSELAQIEGRNPVREALRAGRALECILMVSSERPGPLLDIKAMAHERGVRVEVVDRMQLDRQSVTGRHQGVIAIAVARSYVDVEDILQVAAERNETPLLLLCDEVQDPHNLGALLRSAEATGVHGLVIPTRRAVGLTPTVAKTSAGAVEHVAVARVTNLVQAMKRLKEAGLWIIGAEMSAEQTLWQADMTGPLAVVVGSEGTGLGRLVSEHCDFMVRIPMCGRVNSLNASVAGSLILFEVLRQRQRQE
ncbi:MAG: 23S rRNA (guanosine(2251)-2'-O)-methyltransferase RlmB [Limnochordia bacterium]